MLPNLLRLTLNKVLRSNEGSLALLRKHAGKSFNLNFLGISLSAEISKNGDFSPAKPGTEHDVSIIIPSSTASYLVTQDKLAAFKQITFTGNIEFGRTLLEILSNLHFTGLYANISPGSGAVLAQLSTILKIIREQLRLMRHNSGNSISEYLLYESTDIATRHEIAGFCADVDELNDRTNIIQQRINLLLATKL